MPSGLHALDFVDKCGHGIDSAVVGSGPKLGHREEVEAFNVGIDTFGNDLLKKFPDALHECNGSVHLGDTIIWFLWFINDYNRGLFPWVYTLKKASV